MLTVTVVLAAVYSHYLYGFDLLDPSLDTSRGCLMEDEAYIQFVVEVFVYVELAVYSLLPFVCLVLANGVLVWKLSSSVRQARHSLATGREREGWGGDGGRERGKEKDRERGVWGRREMLVLRMLGRKIDR